MSVDLSPSELGFRRPFDHEVSQVLHIRNPNSEPLAFKVKTTAPKQYCVRPNAGKIEPGETVDVSVVLQPMKSDPPPDAKCKDKFLVQSAVLSGSGSTPSWSDIERTAKSSIVEHKIRVTYLPAGGSNGSSSKHVNGVEDSVVDNSRASPPPTYTPQGKSSQTIVDDSAMSSSALSSRSDRTSVAGGSAGGILGHGSEDLRRQLDEANATIKRLRSEAEEGLRRRLPSKEAIGTTLAPQTMQQTGQTGVPVPTVALISLFVFILTYLLF